MQDGRDGVFSVVSALYDVERYLDDFLGSLERQTYGFERLDVVLVDDGSSDGTHERAVAWAHGRPNVRVLRQENAGQGAARNRGLDVAQHAWVTFTDPDDHLADDYFERVHAFMTSEDGRGAALYATRLRTLRELDGTEGFTHALDAKFRSGDRLVDLEEEPTALQAHGASSFFDRSLVEQHGLRFDEQLRPNFEDVHLVVRYLLAAPRPTLGIVASAEYVYRKRADGTSTLQNLGDDRPLTIVLERGYLDLVGRFAPDAPLPEWLQNLLLYCLSWILRSSQRIESRYAALGDDVGLRFVTLARQVCARLDDEVVRRYDVHRLSPWIRAAVRLDLGAAQDVLRRGRVAARIRGDLVQVRYFFSGDLPEETFEPATAPVASTVRTYEMLGQCLVQERVLWIEAGRPVRVHLDGRELGVRHRGTGFKDGLTVRRVRDLDLAALDDRQAAFLPWTDRRRRSRVVGEAAPTPVERTPEEDAEERSLVRALRWSPRARRRRRTWVLMDRPGEAGDNAEALYRWMRRNRPRTPTVFVLDGDSPDWARLAREGFRLVERGSREHTLLMLSCAHVLSSHARREVSDPLDARRFGPRRWAYTFLQHGVTKGDVSRWFNTKSLDLLVTTCRREHDSIAGRSPYRLSGLETVLTGMPRLDQLRDKDAQRPDAPDVLLVAPTWRRHLSVRGAGEDVDLTRTRYWQAWTQVLSDPALHEVARRHGLRVVLLPHPNVRDQVLEAGVPDGVEVVAELPYDIQQYLASAALMVTDYSSVAFDLAVLGRPTVYHQFDADEFYAGNHNERRGWFSYVDDGFGPVADHPEQVSGLVAALLDDEATRETYAARSREVLEGLGHDSCSARVVAAVEAIGSESRR